MKEKIGFEDLSNALKIVIIYTSIGLIWNIIVFSTYLILYLTGNL